MVDDLGSRAEGLFGGAGGLLEAAVIAELDLDDLAAFLAQLPEEGRLVLVALAADELAVRVVAVRPHELAALDGDLELRQVRAGEIVRQVGGREAKRAVSREAHHLKYPPDAGPCLCGKKSFETHPKPIWIGPPHLLGRRGNRDAIEAFQEYVKRGEARAPHIVVAHLSDSRVDVRY